METVRPIGEFFSRPRLPLPVYSLNVPLPSEVPRRAEDLAVDLPSSHSRARGEHTLVAKRLGTGDRAADGRYEARAREALSGTAPFALRIDRVDVFEAAATGTSPVVFLAVESPGLLALHERLCGIFDPVEDVEGDAYVPHVTIARGGSFDAARDMVGPIDEPIEWTAEYLECFDAERGVPASRISLPA